MAEDLTLALSLAALRRLADPAAAVADARRWSAAVCLVTDEPVYALTKFVRDHDIEQDYYPAPEPAAESLAEIRGHFRTDRYVFVGTDAEVASVPDERWERKTVAAAAGDAGWELADDDPAQATPAFDPFPDEDDADWL